MIRHLNNLLEARGGHPAEIAKIANLVAENFPNSPIASYAESIAAKNLRLVLREDTRTHLGRMAAPIR